MLKKSFNHSQNFFTSLKFKRKPCKVAKKYEQGKCKKVVGTKTQKNIIISN